MKQIFWTTVTMIALAGLSGCGGQSDAPQKESTDSGEATTDATPTEDNAAAVPAREPREAVGDFLMALQQGNDRVAENLLTNKARAETKRHDMVVQPPGSPNASYEVGRVEYPDGEAGAAFVQCTWREKFDDDSVETFEVVWVLRLENQDWRISGMATQLSENTPPVFLNFEDPEDMMKTVSEADEASRQEAVASTPDEGAPTNVR
jgi:hypothetical protein